MKITEFPQQIARAAMHVNELEALILKLRDEIAQLEGQAELIIAFETDLKNDNQRKARKFELLQGKTEYISARTNLIELSLQKSNALAELEQLRNEFSVAKILARTAIAEKLTSAEITELVGV